MMSPSSLVIAAPSGSYGTGTPQRPLTIVSIHDANWIPPFGDMSNMVNTSILFNILPPTNRAYRIWFSQITFAIYGYMSAGSTVNVFVSGYGSLMAVNNPSTEIGSILPTSSEEINRAMADCNGAPSANAIQMYATKSNFCDYPGGLILPTGWGVSAYTYATSAPATETIYREGSSFVTIGYDIP